MSETGVLHTLVRTISPVYEKSRIAVRVVSFMSFMVTEFLPTSANLLIGIVYFHFHFHFHSLTFFVSLSLSPSNLENMELK